MKLPNKVIIGGQEWKIEEKTSFRGGRGSTGKALIVIGKTNGEDEKIQTFLHEVFECILVMNGHRYENEHGQVFVFDHRQFEKAIDDLYLAIKPILK